MTTTTPRKPRRVNPVQCDLFVVRRAAYPCDLLPEGQPALISLNDKPYAVSVNGDAVTFHNERASHTCQGGTCGCEDYVFVREARGEACKHLVAAAALLADGTI